MTEGTKTEEIEIALVNDGVRVSNSMAERYDAAWPRDEQGRQPLTICELPTGRPVRWEPDQSDPLRLVYGRRWRQKWRNMSDEDKAKHHRALYVKLPPEDGEPKRPGPDRLICWSDDAERRASYERRGFALAEDPYIAPEQAGGKKSRVIVVKVPHSVISPASAGAKPSGK